MEYQLYDLRNLDSNTRSLTVSQEIDALLENQVCSICGNKFEDHEKDEVIVSGEHPLTFAHDYCYAFAHDYCYNV